MSLIQNADCGYEQLQVVVSSGDCEPVEVHREKSYVFYSHDDVRS